MFQSNSEMSALCEVKWKYFYSSKQKITNFITKSKFALNRRLLYNA